MASNHTKVPICAPLQMLESTLVGGPLAPLFLLWRNFRRLGKLAAARLTLIFGLSLFAIIVATHRLVRGAIPDVLYLILWALVGAAASLIAARFQLTKDAIQQSETFEVQSGWRVRLMSVAMLVPTFLFAGLVVVFVYPDVRDTVRSIMPGYHADAAMARGDYATAIVELNWAIGLKPTDARFYFGRAWSKQHVGDLAGAIDDYRRDVALDPGDAKAHNNLAWLLATAEPPSLRDGRQAVAAGLRANELTEWTNSVYVGTLAAAYARNGDYAKAVEMHLRAGQLVGPRSSSPSADQRLALYRSGKPWPPD